MEVVVDGFVCWETRALIFAISVQNLKLFRLMRDLLLC
jgi:hypothetical protein